MTNRVVFGFLDRFVALLIKVIVLRRLQWIICCLRASTCCCSIKTIKCNCSCTSRVGRYGIKVFVNFRLSLAPLTKVVNLSFYYQCFFFQPWRTVWWTVKYLRMVLCREISWRCCHWHFDCSTRIVWSAGRVQLCGLWKGPTHRRWRSGRQRVLGLIRREHQTLWKRDMVTLLVLNDSKDLTVVFVVGDST